MKYAIVIPDGCADESQVSLGGRTPLQAASKPNMDRIAREGIVGQSNNVPESLPPAGRACTDAVRQRLAGGPIEFHAGVSYRNLMVYRGSASAPAPFSATTATQAPHDIPDRPVAPYLP